MSRSMFVYTMDDGCKAVVMDNITTGQSGVFLVGDGLPTKEYRFSREERLSSRLPFPPSRARGAWPFDQAPSLPPDEVEAVHLPGCKGRWLVHLQPLPSEEDTPYDW